MERISVEGKTFDTVNFTKNRLPEGEYEQCRFIRCDLSASDLSGIAFIDCEFTGCNLTLAPLNGTTFRDVSFTECKMVGLRFEKCNTFGFSVSFDRCMLTNASFYKLKMKKTTFRNAELKEADFTECDLSGSLFDRCDLAYAVFNGTMLEKADLRTSFNYSIDPERNRMKKAKFALSGVPGLLEKYSVEIDRTL